MGKRLTMGHNIDFLHLLHEDFCSSQDGRVVTPPPRQNFSSTVINYSCKNHSNYNLISRFRIYTRYSTGNFCPLNFKLGK